MGSHNILHVTTKEEEEKMFFFRGQHSIFLVNDVGKLPKMVLKHCPYLVNVGKKDFATIFLLSIYPTEIPYVCFKLIGFHFKRF